uniref:FecR family protein n=1 Tax=Pedobacter schmidteae TaxID=2201271 RepID=UPI000EB4E831|nr:FecR domain-containing protein [Pedobacter schmidteae]
MTTEEAKALILRYNAGKCSDTEQELVEAWYQQFATDEASGLTDLDLEKVGEEIWTTLPDELKVPKTVRLWPRIAAAVAVFLVIGGGLFLYVSRQSMFNLNSKLTHQAAIAPGKNKAFLTLANGTAIPLSEARNGVVIDASQIKYDNGEVIHYSSTGTSGKKMKEVAEQLVISTPRGGMYQVQLPDGSKVWLNADSKISFPEQFKGLVRKVLLEGEAYFEVAKVLRKEKDRNGESRRMPFVVVSKGQEVEVLGTHFNISAYGDENQVKTTLLEGKVRVNDRILEPNQQSVQTGGRINVLHVNAADVLDWKGGEFVCRNEPLESIMKKIARWYDVEVIYSHPDLKLKTFSGSLSRSDEVLSVLKAIEQAGTMKFKLEGKRVYVQ